MTRALDNTGLKRLHREWRRRSDARLALVLDGVQQPFNVGSIVRTAAAWRVEHLWLAGATALPTTSGARKVSLGCERFLTWSAVDKAVAALGAAREQGYRVVALELASTAVPLHEVGLTEATCLVVGNENHGVSPAAMAAADEVAFLPQLGKVGSMNVAVAAAVAMYEVRRRDWEKATDG